MKNFTLNSGDRTKSFNKAYKTLCIQKFLHLKNDYFIYCGTVHAVCTPVSYTHLDVYKRQVQVHEQEKAKDIKHKLYTHSINRMQ